VPLTICDVGPRDGLQNEPETLEPASRAELVNRLAAAGLARIEAASVLEGYVYRAGAWAGA
jgi:isopropylmalate/homocitrate/citramalate synthase